MLPVVIAISIVGIILYIILKKEKNYVMCLNKGGVVHEGKIFPDFERSDIKKFINDCEKESISEKTAKLFIVGFYNTLLWENEPDCPNIEDSHHKLWEFDEYEIEEVFSYIKNEFKIDFQWNFERMLDFSSFKDILLYLNEKIKDNQAFHHVTLRSTGLA